MKITGNTVLITGGATGIGLSLAETLINAGNEVIVCGRREEKLGQAKKKLPQLHVKACDLLKAKEREALFNWIVSSFKNVNVLVNNAGMQRMIDFRKGTEDLFNGDDEIGINLSAAVHLSAFFIPHFLKQKEAAIVNVSSGLAFVPIAIMPVYCATKAALHSFSISLRHQLKDTIVKVFEIIPPTVDTELDRGTRAKRGVKDRGIQPSEVAMETLRALEHDEYEAAIGMAKNLIMGSRNNPEQVFQNMNK